jgi:hypothetical protein
MAMCLPIDKVFFIGLEIFIIFKGKSFNLKRFFPQNALHYPCPSISSTMNFFIIKNDNISRSFLLKSYLKRVYLGFKKFILFLQQKKLFKVNVWKHVNIL